MRTQQINGVQKSQQASARAGVLQHSAPRPVSRRAFLPLDGISQRSQDNAYAYRPENKISPRLRSALAPEQALRGAYGSGRQREGQAQTAGRSGASPLETMRTWSQAAANVASGNSKAAASPLSVSVAIAPDASQGDVMGKLEAAMQKAVDALNEGNGAGIDPKTGCETCAKRVYKDGSNDAGVSFQTPKGMPASTSGIYVASHEGEHTTRETAKAQEEGQTITNMTVTLQMGCCPECKRFYVKGGTTSVTKIDKPDEEAAVVTKIATLLGNTGENLDMDV